MPVLEVSDASAVSPSKRTRTDKTSAEQRPFLRFAKLSEHATKPTRGSAKAAGYDLYRLVTLKCPVYSFSVSIFNAMTTLFSPVCKVLFLISKCIFLFQVNI